MSRCVHPIPRMQTSIFLRAFHASICLPYPRPCAPSSLSSGNSWLEKVDIPRATRWAHQMQVLRCVYRDAALSNGCRWKRRWGARSNDRLRGISSLFKLVGKWCWSNCASCRLTVVPLVSNLLANFVVEYGPTSPHRLPQTHYLGVTNGISRRLTSRSSGDLGS